MDRTIHPRGARSSHFADPCSEALPLYPVRRFSPLLLFFGLAALQGCGASAPQGGLWLRQRHYTPEPRAAAESASQAVSRARPGSAPQGDPRRQTHAVPRRLVVEVRVGQTWVRRAPSGRAANRGVVKRGARLVSLGLVNGPGCGVGWHRLAMGGYLCGEEVLPTSAAPGGPAFPVLAPGESLPFRYVAVGQDGSGEYLQPEDAASDYFLRELWPSNAVSVTKRVRVAGEWFWRTTRNTFVPAMDAYLMRASDFSGQPLSGKVSLPLAFVHVPRAVLQRQIAAPSGRRATLTGARWLDRFHRAAVTAEKGRGPGQLLELGHGQWVRRRDVRLAVRSQPPEGVGPKEPWVDVDVSQQVLVAYRGPEPVFATLVSTGRGNRTPLGTFRVWVKLAATDMRSSSDESERPYQLWDVPWAVFFRRDFGLHGTYWHDRFGHKKSAGCVNLSAKDARWVFHFLSPTLAPGWWAVLPLSPSDGSVIQVRDSSRSRPGR